MLQSAENMGEKAACRITLSTKLLLPQEGTLFFAPCPGEAACDCSVLTLPRAAVPASLVLTVMMSWKLPHV